MASEAVQIADAVGALINTFLGTELTTLRRWTPLLLLGQNGPELLGVDDLNLQLATAYAIVSPVGRRIARLTRSSVQRDHTIEIAVAKLAPTQELADLADSFSDAVELTVFAANRLPTYAGAALVGLEIPAPVVREQLASNRLFLSFLHATYRTTIENA